MIGAQATRVRRRIGFIEAEFIKIIVTGDLIFRGKRQISLPLGGFSKLQGLARWRWWAVVAFKPVQQVGLRGGGKESAVALIPSIFSTWRRLSIKTDSAVTSASVSFLFMVSSVMRFPKHDGDGDEWRICHEKLHIRMRSRRRSRGAVVEESSESGARRFLCRA